jgi:branched-chain amino acid transport system permease protein
VGPERLMDFIAQSVIIGLVEQAPLVLAAIGFALIYRLTGLINVAYAETLTLGAYFAMWLNTTFELDFYAVLIPTAILSGLLSVATYLLIFRPAKRRNVGSLEMIIISFGLAIVLRHGLQFVFGYQTRFFDVPSPDTIYILGVGLTSFRIVAFLTVVLLSLLLFLFIQKSRYGLQVRALASDEQLAQASGIRPLVVTVMIWFIAGVAGGLAGAFLGVGSSVAPLLGWRVFLTILLIVLVGMRWGIGGVILVGVAAGIALTAMALSFDQVLYAQLVLIVGFIVLLKWRGKRLTETAKV